MLAAEKPDISPCLQNRELSWLMFNRRVLEQANVKIPLLERLKFISIFTTNLDEFYMVRVGSLIDQEQFSPEVRENKTNLTAREQLIEINKSVLPLYELRRQYFFHIMSLLEEDDIQHCKIEALEKNIQKELKKLFLEDILPLLSPQIIDSRHPFPHLANKQLHIAVSLEKKKKLSYGIIAVPPYVERLVFLKSKTTQYVLIEELICYFADVAFEYFDIIERTIIAITRNADINTEEDLLDEGMDYRKHMKQVIKKRQRLAPARLEIQYGISQAFQQFLCEKIGMKTHHIFESGSPLDYTYVFSFEKKLQEKAVRKLIWAPFSPRERQDIDKKTNLFKRIQKKDMLLSFPYESIFPFLLLIHQAVEEPSVISIKITLYRLARQSKLAEYLILAAENGKEVVVLMELRARFDENNNIEWAQRLEEAGCRIIYGPAMYKTHSKICLITKKDFGGISYITQIGTGNYNETTARTYTDLSLITANPRIGKDAIDFFNNLMLGNLSGEYTDLWVSPYSLKQNFIAYVDKEIEKVQKGEVGSIIIKCNSLTDLNILEKLIEASRSGVKITMIIRGICCLIPQVKNYTENIKVVSIIGRFLEHSRVFCFGTGPEMEVFISSADLMTRNTERRVEVACPIYDPELKAKTHKILEYLMEDNTKAWELLSSGEYKLRRPFNRPEINTQEVLMSSLWYDEIMPAVETVKDNFLSNFFVTMKKIKGKLLA
ncbi:MAG: polyphosphate kinase 1 [Clostridiales bacterium]